PVVLGRTETLMVAGRLTSTKKQLRKLIVGAVGATVVMALVGHAAAAEAMQADINGPFGLPTVAISEGQWSATWRDLQSQTQSEKRIIAQCRAEPHLCTSSAALRFISLVKEGEQYDGLLRIARINRAVNFAIRPLVSQLGHRHSMYSRQGSAIA